MNKSYRDLYIWEASVALAARIIDITDSFPWHQRRVLVDQMQRSAVSVPSNIAEGKGRLSQKELRHYLGTARASLFELRTQIEIASRVRLLNEDQKRELDAAADTIGRGINSLLRRLSSTAQ